MSHRSASECTKIAHRRSLAIFTADEGIAGNSAAIFTHFLCRRNRGSLGGIPNSPWNDNSHETTTFGCCNSTSWRPKAVTAVKWRLLHRATMERWQLHSQQPPNYKKSEPTAVKWRVRNSTRGMRFCVVSWLLSFQVPLGILWSLAIFFAEEIAHLGLGASKNRAIFWGAVKIAAAAAENRATLVHRDRHQYATLRFSSCSLVFKMPKTNPQMHSGGQGEDLRELGSYILRDTPEAWQLEAPGPRLTIKQLREARKGNGSGVPPQGEPMAS